MTGDKMDLSQTSSQTPSQIQARHQTQNQIQNQSHNLPIFSFLIRRGHRFLHHNFVCALLNDLFGVQSRGKDHRISNNVKSIVQNEGVVDFRHVSFYHLFDTYSYIFVSPKIFVSYFFVFLFFYF